MDRKKNKEIKGWIVINEHDKLLDYYNDNDFFEDENPIDIIKRNMKDRLIEDKNEEYDCKLTIYKFTKKWRGSLR